MCISRVCLSFDLHATKLMLTDTLNWYKQIIRPKYICMCTHTRARIHMILFLFLRVQYAMLVTCISQRLLYLLALTRAVSLATFRHISMCHLLHLLIYTCTDLPFAFIIKFLTCSLLHHLNPIVSRTAFHSSEEFHLLCLRPSSLSLCDISTI